jgi:diguanylate cyclase (GGDEF)-like protein/PAS domain S-box-containing protein
VKRKLNKIPVQHKLTIVVAIIITITAVFALSYETNLAYQNSQNSLRADGESLANLYAQVLDDPLRLGDDYEVFSLISAPFKSDKVSNSISNLLSIVLLDESGIVLSSSEPKINPLGSAFVMQQHELFHNLTSFAEIRLGNPALLELDTDSNKIFVIKAVGENGIKYANLILIYSLTGLQNAAIKQIENSVIVIFCAAILMLFGVWILTNRLTNPLRILNRDMNTFASSHNLELSTEKLVAHDEIFQLNEIFQKLKLSISRLISDLKKRDEEQSAYLSTLDLLEDAVIEFTPQGQMIRATAAWNKISGRDSIENCGIVNCVHPEDVATLLEQISALAHHQKDTIHVRFRVRHDDDDLSQFWVEGRFGGIEIDGIVVAIRGVVRDISKMYLQEKQITHMALHDALTDLPNRVLMEDRLEMAITRAERNGQHVALGFIDLDHFKQVNDTFGHKVGDNLLKEVTKRLSSAFRTTDTLARWGGDEFVVLCPDLISLEDARDFANKLALMTRENIVIDGTEFPFTFSAGFAVYPDDASNSEMLLSQADRAMFYAKAQGRNNIQFFNSIAAKEPGRQSFYIQSRLATAINNKEIQAWLQPLISAKSGKIIGAEVLARWHEQDQGWIPPSVFIPMAESMGLIDKIGQQVWQQALNSFPLLPEGHRLSVNLSKRQLFSSSIVRQFCDDIEKAKIKPEQIMLEITEGIALTDVEYARERIAELDAKGFGIAVDDFGVGYSSLSQLHEIPVDELKLDISFVRRVREKSGLSMISAILSIAKSLELECVAEGIEDAETAKIITGLGVEILQGYYFAKPMPINEYLNWLENKTMNR